jgi:two-component system sensor histidine kinase EvgS
MRNPAMQPSCAGRRWRRSGAGPAEGLQLHLDAQGASPSNILVDADATPDCQQSIGERSEVQRFRRHRAAPATDAGGASAALLLEVIDSGIGIAPAQVATLFQPFQQGSSGQRRGGSGLGFHRARAGPRDGGDLTVHSVLGRGSRFILRLPVCPAGTGVDAQDMPVGDTPLAGLHLLLVEDHELNRHVIAEQLRGAGARVRAVKDAAMPWPNRHDSPAPLL